MVKHCGWLTIASLLLVSGCNNPPQSSATPPLSKETAIVLISVTSDANENPQSVDMAMKLAGFSLDEGRKVVMFFNVKGVTIPLNKLADDFAFQSNQPLKAQLTELIKRGVDVHVCPICMKALSVEKSDLIEGANVTTRPNLFTNIGANTSVFTY